MKKLRRSLLQALLEERHFLGDAHSGAIPRNRMRRSPFFVVSGSKSHHSRPRASAAGAKIKVWQPPAAAARKSHRPKNAGHRVVYVDKLWISCGAKGRSTPLDLPFQGRSQSLGGWRPTSLCWRAGRIASGSPERQGYTHIRDATIPRQVVVAFGLRPRPATRLSSKLLEGSVVTESRRAGGCPERIAFVFEVDAAQ